MTRPHDPHDLYLTCRGKGGCGQTKHCSEFNWSNGYSAICKSCRSKRRGYIRERKRVRIQPGYLRCIRCHRDFPEEEFRQFFNKKTQKYVRGIYCKPCEKIHLYEWETINPEKRRITRKRYKQKKAAQRAAERIQGEITNPRQLNKIRKRSIVDDFFKDNYTVEEIMNRTGLHRTTINRYRREMDTIRGITVNHRSEERKKYFKRKVAHGNKVIGGIPETVQYGTREEGSET